MISGIVTFHTANNYGAVLQAYALKSVCSKYCEQCDIIDYRSVTISERYRLLLDISSPKRLIKSMLRNAFLREKYKRFNDFRKYYLCSVAYEEKKYDVVIAGSDQIWNYNLTNGDSGYFLDFVEEGVKKVAYAPSFGVPHLDSAYEKMYKNLLSNFACISAREPEGKHIIESLFGMKSEIVLDPTLLLTKKEWIDSFQLQTAKRDYIFCYLFGMSDNTKRFIQNLSRKTGYKVVGISDNISLKNDGIRYDRIASPKTWISYIYNAAFVITNSFHGTAFSIIFEKQFYIGEILDAKGRGRIDNLLRITELEDRKNLVEQGNINYENVRSHLQPHIEASVAYLKTAISEE